jgi:hypothetical protein
MTRYRSIDQSPRFLAGDLDNLLLPGHVADAVHHLLNYRFDLSGFDTCYRNGQAGVSTYGRGCMTTEPMFVRKPGAAAKYRGWIVSSVDDHGHQRRDVVILDAQDFTGKPIATNRRPVRVPFPFHGGSAPVQNAALPVRITP